MPKISKSKTLKESFYMSFAVYEVEEALREKYPEIPKEADFSIYGSHCGSTPLSIRFFYDKEKDV